MEKEIKMTEKEYNKLLYFDDRNKWMHEKIYDVLVDTGDIDEFKKRIDHKPPYHMYRSREGIKDNIGHVITYNHIDNSDPILSLIPLIDNSDQEIDRMELRVEKVSII